MPNNIFKRQKNKDAVWRSDLFHTAEKAHGLNSSQKGKLRLIF